MKLENVSILNITNNFCRSNEVNHLCHVKTLPYLSVVQSVEGYYDLELEGIGRFQTTPGGYFLAPADIEQKITHNTDKISGYMTFRWVFLDIRLNNMHTFNQLFTPPVILPKEYESQFNLIFDELEQTEDPCDRAICGYRFTKLLLSLSKPADRLPIPIVEVIQYIKQNYCKKITISDLARLTNKSESQFYVYFRNYLKKSPMQYVNDYRLSIASVLLKSTDKSIGEIAEETGICDQFYFCKLFKRKYLCTALEYRAISKDIKL